MNWIKRLRQNALVLCILSVHVVLLSSCAQRFTRLSPEQHLNIVERYTHRSTKASTSLEPYRVNASLRFGYEGDTRRVTLWMWANESPVRLDLMAGVGALLARVYQSETSFMAYLPSEQIAWTLTSPDKTVLSTAFLNMNVPIPFDLLDLAALIQGHFFQVFGELDTATAQIPTMADSIRLTLTNTRLQGDVSVNREGLPVAWHDNTSGWSMILQYDATSPDKPNSITLQHTDGQNAILLIKKRETPKKAFTEKQLQLRMPPGTLIKPLDTIQTM